jgi:hypothetical protein
MSEEKGKKEKKRKSSPFSLSPAHFSLSSPLGPFSPPSLPRGPPRPSTLLSFPSRVGRTPAHRPAQLHRPPALSLPSLAVTLGPHVSALFFLSLFFSGATVPPENPGELPLWARTPRPRPPSLSGPAAPTYLCPNPAATQNPSAAISPLLRATSPRPHRRSAAPLHSGPPRQPQ